MNQNVNSFSNVNPGMIPGQQYAVNNLNNLNNINNLNQVQQNLQQNMNNTNVLASSVNLSSIQSLTDLLLELPIPQETPQQIAKEQVLITANQQHQHVQNNLSNELVQHYLTQQLTNPLLIAKQQMQEMNLNWTNNTNLTAASAANINCLINNSDQPPTPNDEHRTQSFAPQHEANAFLLKMMKDKDMLYDHVVLPPLRAAQQFHNNLNNNNNNQSLTPQQVHQQPVYNEPSVRQTRSQSYWNPCINDQQSQQQNSSTTFKQEQPSQQNYHYNQQSLHQSPSSSLINNNASNKAFENGQSNYQNNNNNSSNSSFAENGQLSNQSSYSNNNMMEFDDNYSSLGDRVKSKKRTNKVATNNVVETPTTPQHQSQAQQSNKQQQYANNNQQQVVDTQPPIIETSMKTNVYNELNSLINDQNENQKETSTATTKTPSKKSKTKSPKGLERRSSTYSTYSSAANSPPHTFAPQLNSQNSTAPPVEKFEAMLNELFNLNSTSKSFDDDENQEEEVTDRKKKKKMKSKMNGDDYAQENHDPSTFLDITLSSPTLLHFINLTAKLKKSNQMKTIPTSKLTNLLTVLTQQIAVQSASLKNKRRKESASSDEDEDEDSPSFSQLVERFELCSDCCLVALNIMTSKGMSSKIYLEECIEQIVAFINSTIAQYTSIGSALTNTTPVSTPKKGSKGSKKSSSSFSGPTSVVANKKVLFKMYNKWSELVSCLVELMNIHAGSLTDTLVLATTRVALNAFFLENLNINSVNSPAHSSNEIQLNALKLTTVIFSQYIDHRITILEEIIHSISRLSKTKRGRVYYKVDGDDKSAVISMFSALSFKLIQCIFSNNPNPKKQQQEDEAANILENGLKDSKESAIREKQQKIKDLRAQYDDALKISYTFLNSFLKKCVGTSASSESDFRVLFEDLVNDLMVVLHKPNWPAAQLITHTLIKLLINNVSGSVTVVKSGSKGASSNVQIMSQLKLTSLDHLGTLCSRYAKEISNVDTLKEEIKFSLTSLLNNEFSVSSISKLDDSTNEPTPSKKKRKNKNANSTINSEPVYNDLLQDEETFIRELHKHLMRYADEENLVEEKNHFAAIYLREMEREFEQKDRANQTTPNENSELESATNDDQPQQPASQVVEPSNNQELFLKKARKFISIYKNASNPAHNDGEYRVIDYKTAESIVKYFDIIQPTTVKSFEFALAHVIATLSSTSNTMIRSRAMKSLSSILNDSPQHYAITMLQRIDLQKAIKAALLDASSSVREATIDLIGKFILKSNSEELIDSYYEIITERILDAGVSVRKRVIKILREICMSYPSYKRIPEICSKIIKRINDDGEGIRKLVSETFTSMWFKEENNNDDIKLKVNCFLHVVATVITDRIGTEWLNQLLTNLLTSPNDPNAKLLKQEEDVVKHQSAEKIAQVTQASAQIVDCLIRDILCSNDQDQRNNDKSKMLSAMTTIWLFGKVCPKLLIDHITTIQSYLTMRCNTPLDIMIMVKVVQIIENVLPKLSNPSEHLLSSIESELTKNIIQSSPQVLLACVSCLSSLIHTHTKNRQLVQELFKKFFALLDYLSKHQDLAQQPNHRPKLLRSLFTCGLFAKHFDFIENKKELFKIMVDLVNKNFPTIEEDYRTEESYLTEFSTYGEFGSTEHQQHEQIEQTDIIKQEIDLDLLLKALAGLGFMFERNPTYSLEDETQKIYKQILNRKLTKKSSYPFKYPANFIVKVAANREHFEEATICCVLKNLTNYLSDELNTEMSLTIEWSKENLKSMVSDEGDTNSVQSSIIQTYLDDIVRCTLSPLLNVRKSAVNLIHIIHNGGIVHPLQLVPYLIAMSSDDDQVIRARADHVLHEIERKYHGFVSMKAKHGITLSYQLHSASAKRGYRIDNVSQNSTVPKDPQQSGQQSNAQSPSSSATPQMSTADDQYVIARLSTLYSVVSNSRQSRRAFVGSLLKHFDIPSSNSSYTNSSHLEEPVNSGEILQFICDNLIWLPYSVWDEPLYILHQLELSISSNANHSHSLFKEILMLEDDDDDELDEIRDEQKYNEKMNRREQAKYQLLSITSEISLKELNNCLKAFYLLTWAKQIFRELFSITDAKMQDYSPNEQQKVWDKQLHRKNMDIRTSESLMNYPTVNMIIDKEDLDSSFAGLLKEYKTFKKIQLCGADSNGALQNSLLQLMRETCSFPTIENNDESMLVDDQGASSSSFNVNKRKKKSKDKKKKKKKKHSSDNEENFDEEDSDSDF